MPKSEVYNMDCMELMKQYPDKHFDLAIVDPPYGIDGNSHRNNKSRGKATKSKDYHAALWSQPVPDEQYFAELIRVSKNQVIWGANHFIDMVPLRSSCWLVWDKQNDGTDFADCELAWTSFTTSVRRLVFKWSGMLQGDMKNKEIRIHPTQKPVKLYSWILNNYAVPGYKILDTHVGSGSSRLACDDYGCEFVGAELDPQYFKDHQKRFEQYKQQTKLFQS